MRNIYIVNCKSTASAYGIGTYLKEYSNILINIGCRVNIIELYADVKELTVIENPHGQTIYIPNSQIKSQDNNYYNRVVSYLTRIYVTDSEGLIFHFHYSHNSTLLDNIKKAYPHAKIIYTIHYLYWSNKLNGDIGLFKKVLSQKNRKSTISKYKDVFDAYNLEKNIFEKTDSIICLSLDTKQLLKEEYLISEKKLHLIPNGLKDIKTSPPLKKRNLRRKYNISMDEKILLFVGRVQQTKGILPLLSCFRKILKVYPLCKLVLAGDGDFKTSMGKCKDIWSNVVFTGRLNQRELYNWYQIADIGLFVSYFEECSYVGIEMMMHSLPIVASDGNNIRNMFFDKKNALIAKIGNQKKTKEFEQEIERAIFSLLSSPDLCSSISKGARKMYEDVYCIDAMKANYRNLYNV